MITPCVNICQMVNNRCVGCGRTLEEIANWSTYNNQQRQLIMTRLQNEKNNRN